MVVPYRLSFKPEEEHALVELLGYGFRHVLIAGGDGTVNYVVGIMKRANIDIPVAVLLQVCSECQPILTKHAAPF